MYKLIIAFTVSLLCACAIQPSNTANTDLTTKPFSACQIQSQQPKVQGIYTAWEKGASSTEALRLALASIANQREIVIRSNSVINSQKKNGQSSQTFERQITASSDFVFSDYQILCKDHVHNEILVSFDDRALPYRINKLLNQHFELTGWQLVSNKNITSSSVIKPFLYKNGINPVDIKLTVNKNSHGWVMSFNQFRLKLRDDEWRQLFTLPPSHNSKLKFNIENEHSTPLNHALFHEQEFRFTLKGKLPTPAFMSIFYLDKDANVIPIRTNVLLLTETFEQTLTDINNQKVIIPKTGIFTAELPERYDLVIDDYLLLLSEQPIQKPASKGLFSGWMELFEKHQTLGLRLTVR